MFSYRGISKLFSVAVILIVMQTYIQVSGQVVFPTPSSSSCEDKAGRQGTCRSITECRSALETSRNERPTHCEFRGRIPVVCCVEGENHVDISPPDNIPECGRKFVPVITNYIANGFEADLNEWPWMALLGEKKGDGIDWFCSGVLINSKWILTAAHCTNRRHARWVRLGEHNYKDDSDGVQHVDVAIARVIYHDGYKLSQPYHDLALIELDRHISFKHGISPVCLPWGEEGKRNLVGQSLDITGWGAEYYNGPLVEVLMEATLKGFSNERCEESYSTTPDYRRTFPEGINQKLLCVGDNARQGTGTCQGDSGGPSVYPDSKGRYFLGGIVSRGYGCGKNDFPGIQVNVAHPQNLAWIKKHAFR